MICVRLTTARLTLVLYLVNIVNVLSVSRDQVHLLTIQTQCVRSFKSLFY